MGSWGTGIFEDDFASDMRDLYEELVAVQFSDEAIFAEMQQAFGRAEGIEESTFWIALALLQHKFGRLEESVKGQALHFIDSGRALQDWAELTEEGDPAVASRNKQLLKARAAIVSVQPKRKTRRPSKELLERIDRTYSSFPWKEGGLYAYRLANGEYVVLAAVRVLPLQLGQHYTRQGAGFVPVVMPNLIQPVLLLLDYRQWRLPSPAETAAMQPFVRPIKARDRKEYLEIIDENHADHETDAQQTFAEFERENRDSACHAAKSDQEFLAHYEWWVGWNKKQRDLYADREQALKRYFYILLMIDAKLTVPVDRLVDLEASRHFDCEHDCIRADWETLDNHLVSKRRLDDSHTVHLWPAA